MDGVIRFPTDNRRGIGRALVSVKGGRVVTPTMVRDLVGTVETQRAELGVLIMLTTSTTLGVRDAVRHSGTYTWPVNGRQYPKVQIISVADFLSGRRPDLPPPFMPYIQAQRLVETAPQLKLEGLGDA